MDHLSANHNRATQSFPAFCQTLYASTDLTPAFEQFQYHCDYYLTPWLFCLWYAYRGWGRTKHQELSRLEKNSYHWHVSITQPLKALLSALQKHWPNHQTLIDEATAHIQHSAEIEAYLMSQNMSSHTIKSHNTEKKLHDACKNWLLLSKQRQRAPEKAHQAVYALFSTVFSDLSTTKIQYYCSQHIIKTSPHKHQFELLAD